MGPHVTGLNRVNVPKRMLHTESPLDGGREFYVFDNVVGGIRTSICRRCKGCETCAAGLDTTATQEVRSLRGRVHVDGRAELRRQRQDTDVVIQNVVAHAETATDGGLPVISGG